MNVIIVGSRGYVGTALVCALRLSGCAVLEIEHNSQCIDVETGLIRSDYSFPQNYDSIIYLAQSPFYRTDNVKPVHLLTVSVLNSVRVAELAVKAGIRRYLYLSTGNVYAPSFAPLSETAPLRRDNWYSISKVHAEEALQQFRHKLDLTIVRPFGVYGPNQFDKLVPNIMDCLLNGRDVLIDRNPLDPNDHEGLKISLCYIDDAVQMLIGLLNATNVQTINMAGVEVLSIRGIATAAARFLDVTPKFNLTDRYREFDLIADISCLQKAVKFQFTPFAEGVNAMVNANLITKL